MGNTEQSIQQSCTIASDIAIRTHQAQERRETDTALIAIGRSWESPQASASPSHHRLVEQDEVFVLVDLTSNDLDSCAFVVSIFPYKHGDRCVWFDLERAQAILRLAHIAATLEQLDVLEHTGTIVGYTFKARDEIAQCFPNLFLNYGDRADDVEDMTLEEAVAKFFHDTYERLMPQFHYQTRASSAVPWSDVPANNKELMIAVCREVIQYFGNGVG